MTVSNTLLKERDFFILTIFNASQIFFSFNRILMPSCFYCLKSSKVGWIDVEPLTGLPSKRILVVVTKFLTDVFVIFSDVTLTICWSMAFWSSSTAMFAILADILFNIAFAIVFIIWLINFPSQKDWFNSWDRLQTGK